MRVAAAPMFALLFPRAGTAFRALGRAQPRLRALASSAAAAPAMPPVTLLSGFLGAGKTQRPAAVTIFESF